MKGLVSVTSKETSSPVAAPSPPVNIFGLLFMPFTTVLTTLKLLDNVVTVKVRSPRTALLRESKALSEGELVRVGTFPDGGLTESVGKILYISILTRVMSNKESPLGKSPMNVAWSTVVPRVAMKSSAASISISPPPGGLEAMPIKPSGDPVLKENGEVA